MENIYKYILLTTIWVMASYNLISAQVDSSYYYLPQFGVKLTNISSKMHKLKPDDKSTSQTKKAIKFSEVMENDILLTVENCDTIANKSCLVEMYNKSISEIRNISGQSYVEVLDTVILRHEYFSAVTFTPGQTAMLAIERRFLFDDLLISLFYMGDALDKKDYIIDKLKSVEVIFKH